MLPKPIYFLLHDPDVYPNERLQKQQLAENDEFAEQSLINSLRNE